MKTLIKLLAALAAVVGAVYAIATYGEQIVAWARSFMAKLPKCPCCQECAGEEAAEEAPAEETEEAPAAEDAPVEEAPAEEAPEAPVEAAPTEPVAEDNDFAE